MSHDAVPFDDAPEPFYFRRSESEHWANCPAQGDHCERHPEQFGSLKADAGDLAHGVIDNAVTEWLDSGEHPSEFMVPNAQMTRPDVQPDVLAAVRPVVWTLGSFLRARHRDDILRWSGGPDKRPEGKDYSGQVAFSLLPAGRGMGETFATMELDLLVSTPAPTVLKVIDFKGGQTKYNMTQVASSWQARFYAMVVHEVYPECMFVDFEIWMTRLRSRTPAVRFSRRDSSDMKARVLMALEARHSTLQLKPHDAPGTIPGETKCLRCPMLMECDHAHHAARKIGKDPVSFVETTMHLAAMVKARKALQDKWGDEHGPIKSPAGTYDRHPVEKPKARPYSFKETKDDNSDSGTT